ncbi:MAG: App1 family protein [Rhodoglobus sp.]
MARYFSAPASEPAAQILHRAARIEDAFHRWRERRGRKRGLVTTIIPYTGYGTAEWTRVLCRVVLGRPTATTTYEDSARGWRSFFSIPVENAEVTLIVGDIEQRVIPSRGGIIDVTVPAGLKHGWQEITLRTDDIEPITAPVFILDPAINCGIISDIDDTVMVTALPRPFLAAWNTFVLDEHARRPVAGMAVLYERLTQGNPAPPVIYLSTGAWNVAPTLNRFLSRNLYPQGPLLLTDWGPTQDRWFRSGYEHKRTNLARIAQEFPGIKWLLIGDDGQHDEKVYSDFAARYPQNVLAVAIRQLSTGEAVLAGGRSTAAEREEGSGVRWVYGRDGAELAGELVRAGILSGSSF